jgi:hypothetical protein
MPGAVAFAVADQLTTLPLNVPVAVPATFRSPAHDALNEPVADVAVCCVGFHLKSVQVDGEGMTLELTEAHVPIKAATPVAEGPVDVVVLLEYPTQPLTVTARHMAMAKA